MQKMIWHNSKKVSQLISIKRLDDIAFHPKTGIGHPEPLKGMPENRWSRQISKKHRIVYRIFDSDVYVEVLSAYGHYDDK